MPKPNASMSSSRPARRKYLSAVGEPGANDVFTQVGGYSPDARAFLASSPAAMASRASDVFVQLVMAAMATAPCGGRWWLAFGKRLPPSDRSCANAADVSFGD